MSCAAVMIPVSSSSTTAMKMPSLRVPFAMVLALYASAAVAAQAPPADRSADEKAVRAQIAAFKAAFDKGDPKAVAALYAPEGRVVGPDGTAVTGRDAVAEQFKTYFAENPGATIEVRPESIRFLGADVAQEEGVAIVKPADGSEPRPSRYCVLYVKQGEQWLQHEVRDYTQPAAAAESASEVELVNPLSELDWLIGEWVDESPEAVVRHTCRYILGRRYILREYNTQRQGEAAVEGFHLIGYDPQAGVIRSWGFDAEGSRGEAAWSREGDRWVIKMTGVLGDGTTVSATQLVERVNNDTMKLSSIERTIGGETAPSREDVFMVRKPPEPSIPDAAPAEAKPAAAPAAPAETKPAAPAETKPATPAAPADPATPAIPRPGR